MDKLKVIYLGCTNFSKKILLDILNTSQETVDVKAIFSIPQEFDINYSKEAVKNYTYANMKQIADVEGIDYFEIDHSLNKKITSFKEEIEKYDPDVILVMGWYYMIPESIRKLAKMGAWGIHASLLPKYAGGAPLVWAMINGEDKTGTTLFRLDDGVDDGDIISQKTVLIEDTDTIDELYKKITSESSKMLINALTNISSITFLKQKKEEIQIYDQRSPEDGKVDLTWDKKKIYDFIRAQSYPYPGAFIELDNGCRMIFEKVRIERKK